MGGIGDGSIQASPILGLHSTVLFYGADEIRYLRALTLEYVQDQWHFFGNLGLMNPSSRHLGLLLMSIKGAQNSISSSQIRQAFSSQRRPDLPSFKTKGYPTGSDLRFSLLKQSLNLLQSQTSA